MTNNISRRNPRNQSLLSDFQEELNRLFDVSWPSRSKQLLPEMADWAPAIDIKDEEDRYVIQADVPGVDPNNIEVVMHNDVLTIKGQKEVKSEEKKDNYVKIERARGTFARSFTLPDSADADRIKAKSKNGVLEIIIPKSKKSSSKKINVES